MRFFDPDGLTPVLYNALISTVDEDGSSRLSPVLPVSILGLRATMDLEINAKTTRNLTCTGKCVLNLTFNGCAAATDHSAELAGAVSDPHDEPKLSRNYCGQEYQVTRLAPATSEVVSAQGALLCPVKLEAAVTGRQRLNRDKCEWGHHSWTIEVRIFRIHIDPLAVLGIGANRGRREIWEPLMACLREAYQPS